MKRSLEGTMDCPFCNGQYEIIEEIKQGYGNCLRNLTKLEKFYCSIKNLYYHITARKHIHIGL
jgi:uncharacterized protein YbaR (Trm112 family)